MSLDAREWVWDHSRSKGTARMVLALIADRCRDRNCVAYASVPTLMKRANASRTAVRDALAKLIADGELVALGDRKGPRGETYYHLPEAARFLAEHAIEGDREPAHPGIGFRPSGCRNPALPILSKRGRNTAWGNGIRPREGTDSDPPGARIPTPRTVENQR